MTVKPTAKTVVVLIHGTFAREAEWTSPEAPCPRTIATDLEGGVEIVPFRWSGRNSHRARAEAADQLGQLIADLMQRFPETAICLVAHSHGGNVALYALRDNPKLVSAVRCIVNMATPYIIPIKRNIDRYVRTVVAFLVLPMALIVAFALMSGALALVDLVDSELVSGLAGDWLFPLALVIAAGFFALVRWCTLSRLVPRLISKQGQVAAALTHQVPDSVPMLNLRISGDEASAWLRTVSILANLPYWIWNPATIAISVVGLALALSAFAFFAAEIVGSTMLESPGLSASEFGVLVLFYFSALVFVAFLLTLIWQVISTLWSNLFSASALGFGGFSVYLNWLIRVMAQPTLGGSHTTEQFYTRPFTFRGFRHSLLYGDAAVIKDIVNWLKQHMTHSSCGSPANRVHKSRSLRWGDGRPSPDVRFGTLSGHWQVEFQLLTREEGKTLVQPIASNSQRFLQSLVSIPCGSF